MKKLLFSLLLLSGIASSDSGPFFWGARQSAEMFPSLSTISFGGQSLFIEKGSIDPSATATFGPRGSMYLSTLGNAYIKTDAGISTNWVLLGPAGGAGISALSGDLSTVGTSGTVPATVNTVGGSTSANIHLAEGLVNANTWANTPSTTPWRNATGSTELSYLALPWISTPTCLHTQSGLIYTKNDGLIHFQDQNCVESVLGGTGTGTGTVTAVSVVSANGLAGTVATSSTTPAITLSTTVTGLVKGNGTAISAATLGTDYAPGTSANATGIVKSTTTTGALTTAVSGTDYAPGTSANATGLVKSTTSTGVLTTAVSGTDYAPGTAANTTGIVKSTTSTGALTTAIASDFPTLNQSTSGNAATATTATNATNGATVSVSNNASYFLGLHAASSNSNQPFNLGVGLTFNPSTDILALGVNATQSGGLAIANGGGSGASVVIQNPSATTGYNFNLPATSGTSGFALLSAAGGSSPMTWGAILSNPMSTTGDMIYGGTSGAATRMVAGTSGQIPISAGATVAFGGLPGNSTALKAPTVSTATISSGVTGGFGGVTGGYLFTVSSANATVGATYTNNSNTYTVLATISSKTQLFCSQASAPQASGTLTKTAGTGDSTITFSSAAALKTYTTPTSPSPLFLKVRMVGGGAGGGGSSSTTSGSDSSPGTSTAFGASFLIANGGTQTTSTLTGGFGGSASFTSPALGNAFTGSNGQSGENQAVTSPGTLGGMSPFGGGSGTPSNSGAGMNASPNTGSGGGGAGSNATATLNGGGGGAGGYVDVLIPSPSSTYFYVVGNGGSGGSAGVGAGAAVGGNGAGGYIEIIENYQ